ncbi:hypothetical protein DPEC_G00291640 [Dallia pectoralis]|uniref:Uncharacterized protein n=1 Tax=Dallia pectoralis TaxID=75939 RepID=A0ACC2FHQ1_DALPE|nr:hypothetical protein DPEC_G00291640 [Dallia pectoralis]
MVYQYSLCLTAQHPEQPPVMPAKEAQERPGSLRTEACPRSYRRAETPVQYLGRPVLCCGTDDTWGFNRTMQCKFC